MKIVRTLLLLMGVVLIISGVLMAGAADIRSLPISQDVDVELPPEGAEYVGSASCFTCHSDQHRNWSTTSHPYMIQDVSANPGAILADFAAGEDVRGDQPYALEDIVFTMGSKHNQRYIAASDDGYVVLPGQWSIDSGAWVAADSADWLKDCAGCHTTGFDVETSTWAELSVGCESCHGAGSVHVEAARALPEGIDPMSEDVYAVRSTIVSTVDSAVCAQCHTRGMSPDGAHGYPIGYVVGGPLDETMFTLSMPVEGGDEAWWADGTERDYRQQYPAWLGSAHGNALATITEGDHSQPFCLACHSTDYDFQDPTFPQDVVTLENAQFSITCVQCHSPHGEGDREAQLVGESYDLCVSCHTGTSSGNSPIRVGNTVHHPMREMFEGISFLGLEPRPSKHFANDAYGPICASCHMTGTGVSDEWGHVATHSFQVVIPTQNEEGQADSCTTCHNAEHDPDNSPEDLAFYIEDVQADTRDRIDDIRAELEAIQAENPDWATTTEDKSEEQVMSERIHTLVSFIEADGSWGFHNPEYTDDILVEAEDLLDELLDILG